MKYKTLLLRKRKILRWRINELRRLNDNYKPVKATWYREFGYGGCYEFHEKYRYEHPKHYRQLVHYYKIQEQLPTPQNSEHNYFINHHIYKFSKMERLITIKLILLPRYGKDVTNIIVKYVEQSMV